MQDLWGRVVATFYQIIASVVGYILYHLNELLVALASAFRSRSIDQLSTHYSSWYNGYLLTSILRSGGVRAKVVEQYLNGILMIVTVSTRGIFSPKSCSSVLASYLGIQPTQIQITKLAKSSYKIVFPIT